MPIPVNSDTSQRPSAQQMQEYLASLGATPGESLMLTGAATSESGRDPGAVHDNGIGFGMFGHNGDRLNAMQQFASQNKQNVGDWRTQTAFALNELRSRPEGKAAAEATTPQQAALAQMYYEQPKGFTPQNPEAGMNYAGRLQTIQSLASGDKNAPVSFASGGASTATASGGPFAVGVGAGRDTLGAALDSGGGNHSGTISNVGNPQLNAALAKMLAQPTSDGYQPLVSYAINKGASSLFNTLGSLLGGGSSPPVPASESAGAALAPSGAAPATTPSTSPQEGGGASAGKDASLPFFAAGPPPASPIVTPTLGPVSNTPTMAQSGGLGGIASLLGLGSGTGA